MLWMYFLIITFQLMWFVFKDIDNSFLLPSFVKHFRLSAQEENRTLGMISDERSGARLSGQLAREKRNHFRLYHFSNHWYRILSRCISFWTISIFVDNEFLSNIRSFSFQFIYANLPLQFHACQITVARVTVEANGMKGMNWDAFMRFCDTHKELSNWAAPRANVLFQFCYLFSVDGWLHCRWLRYLIVSLSSIK